MRHVRTGDLDLLEAAQGRIREVWIFATLMQELDRDDRFVQRVELLVDLVAERSAAALTPIDAIVARRVRVARARDRAQRLA